MKMENSALKKQNSLLKWKNSKIQAENWRLRTIIHTVQRTGKACKTKNVGNILIRFKCYNHFASNFLFIVKLFILLVSILYEYLCR